MLVRFNIPVLSTFLEDLTFVPTLCLQCEKAYCVEVCPTPALTKNDQTGVVDFDKDKCIGCKQCIIACPWGSIKQDVVLAKQKGTAARLKEIGKDLAKGVSS
jgi:Fe-S-cluster-containing dehydrogenase component